MALALQLFKNSIDTQDKLRLNLHSLSVSELLEYGRYCIVYKMHKNTLSFKNPIFISFSQFYI
jgi:hypothetical protein